jgi:hypothetical protein
MLKMASDALLGGQFEKIGVLMRSTEQPHSIASAGTPKPRNISSGELADAIGALEARVEVLKAEAIRRELRRGCRALRCWWTISPLSTSTTLRRL